MGGKKPLRRPLWPPTRATASNYYPLGLDGAGGAAKPLLRAPKKPAPLHGRLPAFSGAVDAFERARKCFLEWRYFFSIILSEFLKNRVALHAGSASAGERTVRMGRQRPRIGAVVSGCRLRGGFYPVPKSDPGWLGLCGCGEGGWHFPMGLLQARRADAEKAPPRHRGAPGAIFLRPVQKQDAVYI